MLKVTLGPDFWTSLVIATWLLTGLVRFARDEWRIDRSRRARSER